jgi:hypothetical protein
VVDVPNSEDEEPTVAVVVFPNSELFVAALCAVSPEGAKILVLLFAGCSELALALRPEKRPPPLEAGVPEDWPKGDMVRGAVRGGAQGSYVDYGTVYFCLRDRVQNFQARPGKLDAGLAGGLAGPMTIWGLPPSPALTEDEETTKGPSRAGHGLRTLFDSTVG